MIPSEPRTPGPCEKDCPNRSPTCHNVNTCERWAAHEKEKAERKAKRDERWQTKRMTWEERAACKGL